MIWTDEKLKFIKDNFMTMSDKQLSIHFNCSVTAVKAVRLRHGFVNKYRKFKAKEIDILIELYPNHSAKYIASLINKTERGVYNKAHELGLVKDPEYMKTVGFQKGSEVGAPYRFKKGHVPANKGKKMPEEIKQRVKHTFFQKGNKPANTKYDGYISLRKDKRTNKTYKVIRVAQGKFVHYHRYIWEKAFGPIPKGINITFRDGNPLNCTLENLEIKSNAELMLDNSIMRYPPEVRTAIRLHHKLNRKIKEHGQKQD